MKDCWIIYKLFLVIGIVGLVVFMVVKGEEDESLLELELVIENASSIHVPVVLHIIKEGGGTDTKRSKENVLILFKKSQEIWNQAHIVFDITVEESTFDAVPKADNSSLHIVFMRTLGGSNGIAIAPSLALIADQTTVNDFRATAHEIGHLLGLSHTEESRERLLFQGANGTKLTPEEISIVREKAKKL